MNYQDFVKQESMYICSTYSRYPIALERGFACKVWDCTGKQYLDLLAGIAIAPLGHCNTEVRARLNEQANKLWNISNLFYQQEQLNLAKRLVESTNAQHSKVFFCNSGAEANEAAIKLARRYWQVYKQRESYEIISLSSCFHGRTLGTLAATGRENLSQGFTPLPDGFKQVPVNDLNALKEAITSKTAAVMLEVIQGEGGVLPLPFDYLKGVEALCKEKEILLICDEVQCGLCRSGQFWAWQLAGIKPDITSVAKGLANGLPMGAILATAEVANGFAPGSHATTFGGGCLVASVADKVIEIMQRDNLATRAEQIGNYFKGKLQNLAKKYAIIADVRGHGLMLGLELAKNGKEIWTDLLNNGFICGFSQNKVLRFLPPLIIEQAEIDSFVENLEQILQKY